MKLKIETTQDSNESLSIELVENSVLVGIFSLGDYSATYLTAFEAQTIAGALLQMAGRLESHSGDVLDDEMMAKEAVAMAENHEKKPRPERNIKERIIKITQLNHGVKLDIEGEKYEIAIIDYGVDANEISTLGYEIFGFNPDGTPVLLGDNADFTYASEADTAVAAFQHLADIVAWELIGK